MVHGSMASFKELCITLSSMHANSHKHKSENLENKIKLINFSAKSPVQQNNAIWAKNLSKMIALNKIYTCC